MKKFISLVMACMLVTSLAVPAFATEGTKWQNSTGSVKEDYLNDTKVGQDVTQDNKQTVYGEFDSDAEDFQDSQDTEVYATKTSTFSVLIPKTVILDGDKKTGTYVISVKGDVATTSMITIAPTYIEFDLTKKDTSITTKAAISNGAHTFQYHEVEMEGWKTLHEGTITAKDLKAGSWHGTMTFNISYTDVGGTLPETVETTETT